MHIAELLTRLRCRNTVLGLLILANACGPAAPPPRAGPASETPVPLPRLGQPAPATVTATRDLTVVPSGDYLAALCNTAASRVPLYYLRAVAPEESEAAKLRRVREFERWVHNLQRSAKVKQPAQVAKLHQQHGTILGHPLSAIAFVRLRAAPFGELTETFAAMTKGAIGPYWVSTRTPVEEAFKGGKVIVRVEATKTRKEAALELTPDRIKELREVKAELARIAATHKKLPNVLQQDLVEIAASGLTPTLSFDAARSRTARQEAVEKAKQVRMAFSQGQVVLKKGELVTLAHREILAMMRSLRCEPCSGGLARCASGPMQLLKVGSISYAPILATRSFRLAASAAGASKGQAAGRTTRVFAYDEKAGEARAKTLKKLLDQPRAADARARWEKLRDGLKKELQVEVLLQLLQSFNKVAPEKLRSAILDLYSRAQATPLVATRPVPLPGEPCILRRPTRKSEEEENDRCTIVPLARFRLELPGKVASEPGLLSSLPAEARKAAVELVQQLLVANTSFDAGETARHGKDTAPKVTKTGERSIQEGEVLVQAGKPLTPADIYLLEQMHSLNCTRVSPRPR